MYAYLTMTTGPREGESFVLKPDGDNRLGRGLECAVVLNDPLCSRVHAVLARDGGHWLVRDESSRNGTFVNEQKIDEATLAEGHRLRLGSTEFSFHETDDPPTAGAHPQIDEAETIVKELRARPDAASLGAMAAVGDPGKADDHLLLYQLSIQLLGCRDPSEVIKCVLELLRSQTLASRVGFLWLSDDGRLKPKTVLPDEPGARTQLSESLTRTVCQERNAVWIANQAFTDTSKSLEHTSDALCAPLLGEGRVLGALHAYLDSGRFRQSQFEFCIALASLASLALVRARHDESLASDFRRLKSESPGYDELVGNCPAIKALREKIDRLSKATGCVLIRGESGTGKELVARAIHRQGPRAGQVLLCVNCAAISQTLLDSQLFGHKSGAFTGADRDHQGFFQQADLGTLFLDEIGELSQEGQAKLLRILDGHSFQPVGSTQHVSVDVRVIAATNQDLEAYVSQRKFRSDLYYRLSVFELEVPPLRNRGGDVELLVEFFLDHFRRRHGRPRLAISDDARRRLAAYTWPGNVRQLRNVLDSAVVLAAGDAIEAGDLPLRGEGPPRELDTLRLDDWERKLIGEALSRTGNSVPEAAKLLGINRSTLYRKLEEYGIERPT